MSGMKTYTPAELRDLAYAAGQDAGNRSMWAAEALTYYFLRGGE